MIQAFDPERLRLTISEVAERTGLTELAHMLKEALAASVLDDATVVCIAATRAGRNVSATLQPGHPRAGALHRQWPRPRPGWPGRPCAR